MKAVRFHEFGGPEVLRVEEVPDPEPVEGQALVRVEVCALNHLDVDVREGISRFPVEFPHTLGVEVVGRIEALGPGPAHGWKPGDRVMPYLLGVCGRCRYCRNAQEQLCETPEFISFANSGGFAEKLVCSTSQLLRVPEEISLEAAGALQVAFATSWHMLFTRAELKAGETVLVSSVGSGIGSAAIQLAKLAGARVIGTASTDEKLERAAKVGLDVGVNYRKQDVVEEVMRLTDGRGVDLAYEHVGGDAFQWALDALRKDGRLVTCGAHAGEVVSFDIIPFFRAEKRVIGSFVFTRAEVERVLTFAGEGRLQPLVHDTFPLDRAREAMETLESRKNFGKVLIVP